MTADPAKQPGLAPFDERGIEQRLFVDRVARPRAGEDVGDDRIGLCKREQNRVAEERLAAAEKLRHAAVAAREPFGPGGVDARAFGFQRGAMLFARRIEQLEFEQVTKPGGPGPERATEKASE